MYLDIIVLIILVASILDGLKNGFFVEFLSVFGLIINFMVAKKITPILMEFLKLKIDNNHYFVTYIVVFWATYIVIGILVHFIRNIMESQSKGIIMRILGGIIGSGKGFILSLILIIIFNYGADMFPKIKKYGSGSYSETVFLETLPTIEKHIPKAFKEKIDRIKNQKLIDRYVNKLF